MSYSVLKYSDISTAKYITTHVFFPLRLPDADDHSTTNDYSLTRAIATAARLYNGHIETNLPVWNSISRMLENLQAVVASEKMDKSQITTQFGDMDEGDVLAFLIRAQNAGVIFRKQSDVTIFESFELRPKARDVMTTEGRLICSYPGPAIQIPNHVFDNQDFRGELVNFLVHMHHDIAGGDVEEESFNSDVSPRYITELLTGILRGVGRAADVVRISKRVGDDVVCGDESDLPWRRSALWLLIKVSLQTTLHRCPLGHDTYKRFMLFFMCCLAEEKVVTGLPGDLLQSMLAKISRRLRKLGSSSPEWLSRIVLQTRTALRSTVEKRWGDVQAAQILHPVWTPSQLDLTQDTQLSLASSRDYLRKTIADQDMTSPEVPFDPEDRRRGRLCDLLSLDGLSFDEAYQIEPGVTLYDVERAVEQDIDAWVDEVTDINDACVKLEALAEKYTSSALKSRANNQELLSITLLTTVELWVALDKIAVKQIPMLVDYSPEVSTSLLEHLLLSKTANLDRLRKALEYLTHRHSQARSGWSVYSSTIASHSFPVRFYRKSSYLRRLRAGIQKVARPELRESIIELRNMHDIEVDGLHCHSGVWGYFAEGLFPTSRLLAQVIVFELGCPISFSMWRTATFRLLALLCSPWPPHGALTELNRYRAFQQHLISNPRPQVAHHSNIRPLFSRTKVPIPSNHEWDRVRSGLRLFRVATWNGTLVSLILGQSNSKGNLAYKLQSGPYQNFQNYVDSTSHTSNEVIANQGDCNEDLSIHEYMAFGHLRSGGVLQWLNILRELRARSFSFRRPEVHILFAQAVSQVGPYEMSGWTWHQEVQQPVFCYALLDELWSLMREVEASWTERVTMDTISFLARRLLASNPNEAVSSKALEFLRSLRNKVFSWVQELSVELVKTPGNEEFHEILRDTAIICRGTFDVDPVMIPRLLSSADDIDILLSCTMIIHDHMPSDAVSLPAYSQLLLVRDSRLSLALETVVRDLVMADTNDEGINLAVRRIWPSYQPGSKWRTLEDSNSRWLSCKTAPPTDQRPQVVHFNILDGSLLISGKPFGTWLPHEVTSHSLYKLLFGKQMLQVLPSDLPGMDYSTKNLISEYQVHFSLRNDGSDLVIRANRKGTIAVGSESGIIELIPQEVMKDDLPLILLEGHVHWLSLSTSIMEIRPLQTPWEASPENWRLDCIPDRYRMWKANECLIDIRSQSWSMVSTLLKPLCTPQDIIATVLPTDLGHSTVSLRLSVFLPHYDLSFYVDEDGDLQSHNMRGMVYDESQSIGTFYGLVNQLVLRPKAKEINSIGLIPRCVLIPNGDISYRMDGHHVRVEIIPHRSVLNRVTYETYTADVELGCLTGNATLTSRLYCACLHALTSGDGADQLTGRSGTEEALSVLQSAGCCSNVRFGPRDADLLCLIASLSPSQSCFLYPRRLIRRAGRRNLPTASHSHEMYVIAKAIKDRYERLQPFHDNLSSVLFANFPSPDDDYLFRRSMRRAAYLCSFSLSSQSSGVNADIQYPARDLIGVGSAERHACTAATLVYRRDGRSTVDIWEIMKSWNIWVSGTSGHSTLSLQYDRSWLSPNLPLIWLKAYNLLRKNDEKKWSQLLFSLPAMVYASPSLVELVPVFIAFASDSRFRSEDPPRYDSYSPMVGYHPSFDTLRTYVFNCAYHFSRSPERLEPPQRGESWYDLQVRQRRMYDNRIRSDADATAQTLLAAWPCDTLPPWSPRMDPNLYDLTRLTTEVRRYFLPMLPNLELEQHLTRVQAILGDPHASSHHPTHNDAGVSTYTFRPSRSIPSRIPWQLTTEKLFTRSAPPLQAPDTFSYATPDGNNIRPDSFPLSQLIAAVGKSATNPFRQRYVSILRSSAKSFQSDMSLSNYGMNQLPTLETLLKHYTTCRAQYIRTLSLLQQHLGPRDQSEEAVEQSGQWPRFTAQTFFRSLASNSPVKLRDDWKTCITKFTLLALEVQRARRMVLLHLDDRHEDLWKEIQNKGCDGWKAETHPDWLLIQLQGNFLIRRVQAEVANEMISPRSGENTAMQLAMGEGKSSVVVPISAVVLSDGIQLVRVIVPKPLITQTLHLLANRLGGLTNRRIYYLPFSRSSNVDGQIVAYLHETMSECLQERGILVVQADHVLSLKLMSMEKQLSPAENHYLVAKSLMNLQKWLNLHSRDILDESDEILDVKSQLVFTIGGQRQVDGSPERWTTIQQVLNLVSKHALSLQELFPLGVEYEPGTHGSFPHLRVLQPDAGETLTSWIVQDIMSGALSDISFGQLHFHPGLEHAIRSFISRKDTPPEDVRLVKSHFGETSLWHSLLLLRGYLAIGILLYAFKERRWRVDYGLAPTRTMLAVPYRAKDVPAQRAEFCHPDIAIILTCLSYYYAGLTEDQLRLSFAILFEKHIPSFDYELWIQASPTVPESLRTLGGVNIKSVTQWNTLCLLFSRNRATVNFYLANVVFPKAAKECPKKLPSSGWDLAEKKSNLVTGFSGTNDGRYLFPLHIVQRDADHQRGTNAQVLSYHLQPENRSYMCTAHQSGKRRTTREFLDVLVAQKPEIQVLLDVGAQMLDLRNYDLAKTWLDLSPNASAAIYFNEDDELMICRRDGSTQFLRSSPFAQQIDRCVVYLDDAHTRGTDIKFPNGFRAAVTLGPRVTKDRLVQGCMRMRMLGNGHSVMFFAPLEVDRRIRAVAGKDRNPSDVIDTTDILHWAIKETWENVHRWIPHWVQQGMDHASRYAAWSGFCSEQVSSRELLRKWLQPEAKTLEDLFESPTTPSSTLLTNLDIRQRCLDLGVLSISSVSMEEEGERELAYEVKREQHVERRRQSTASNVQPAIHSVHPDVIEFVNTGNIPTRMTTFRELTKQFVPAFDTLRSTSAATEEAYIWSQSTLVTEDFQRTVIASGKIDSYLRPVHWIVSAKRGDGNVLVVLSPHEVGCLLPAIRSSNKVHLHLFAPRTTVSMKPCDDLDLYNIPTIPDGWTLPCYLMDQLSVFAGQLYLKDYESYIRLCRFLGVYADDLQDEEGIVTEPDGFILPENRNRFKHSRIEIAHTFARTPLPPLRALMNLRRKGIAFTVTHMGKILDGRVLCKQDFDQDL